VRQLDQLRIGLGPFGAFYVGHFFLYGGSVLPNDRLHKTNYTLIVTELKAAETYYKAEEYHQNYFRQHPLQGYCAFVVEPKVAKLRKLFFNKVIQ
ncbi:peptide-methionine (S)-S-oxide reductase, partial [Collimonas sp.]|uniref:peptide-methionine (S)-S-oxide reductase n=1 Tax=Collimonas sp. TaxID=1963772 RepID=UPI0037C1959B